MTIVVDGDDYIVEQVTKQLNKLVDVIKIKELDESDSVSRELALIKVGQMLHKVGDSSDCRDIQGKNS